MKTLRLSCLAPETVCAAAAALLLSNFFSLSAIAADPKRPEAERMHNDAYLAVVKAEQDRDKEDWESAIELFATALDTYRQIAGKYPGFRSVVVEKQISYCINEINSLLNHGNLRKEFGPQLKDLLQAPVPHYSAPVPPEPAPPPAAAKPDQKPVERSVPPPSAAPLLVPASREEELQKEMRRLRAELFELAQRCATIRDARESAAASAGKDEDVRAAKKRLESEKKKREEAEKEVADIRKALAKTLDEKQKIERLLERAEKESRESSAKKSASDKRMADEGDSLRIENETLRLENLALRESRTPPPTAETAAPPPVDEAPGDPAQLLMDGQLDKAYAAINSRLKANPDNAKLQMLMGILYCRRGDFEAGRRVLEPIVENDQANARARVALAGAYLGLGQYHAARMELDLAIGFDPELSEAHYNLAQVLLAMTPKDPVGARDRYEEALRLGSARDTALEKKISSALSNSEKQR